MRGSQYTKPLTEKSQRSEDEDDFYFLLMASSKSYGVQEKNVVLSLSKARKAILRNHLTKFQVKRDLEIFETPGAKEKFLKLSVT